MMSFPAIVVNVAHSKDIKLHSGASTKTKTTVLSQTEKTC